MQTIFLSTKGAYYGAKKQATAHCALRRDRCLLICIFLSTKGAYYSANKQAFLLSTSGAISTKGAYSA
jgi:hypothetical protein